MLPPTATTSQRTANGNLNFNGSGNGFTNGTSLGNAKEQDPNDYPEVDKFLDSKKKIKIEKVDSNEVRGFDFDFNLDGAISMAMYGSFFNSGGNGEGNGDDAGTGEEDDEHEV